MNGRAIDGTPERLPPRREVARTWLDRLRATLDRAKSPEPPRDPNLKRGAS